MLKSDLFDENGRLVANEPQRPADFRLSLTAPNVGSLPISRYFTIPDAMLQRWVKNSREMALLQRVGELTSEFDKILDSMLSNSFNKEKASDSIILETTQGSSTNNLSGRPFEPSHQPMEESTLFAESSSFPGPPMNTGDQITMQNDSIRTGSSEKEIVASFVALSSILSELQNLKVEISMYQASNQSLVDELAAAGANALADQKNALARSEAWILEHITLLERGWSYGSRDAPWIAPSE